MSPDQVDRAAAAADLADCWSPASRGSTADSVDSEVAPREVAVGPLPEDIADLSLDMC